MSFPRYPKYKDSGVEWLGQMPEHWEVERARSLGGDENTDHADPAAGPHGFHRVVHGHVRDFMASRVMRPVATCRPDGARRSESTPASPRQSSGVRWQSWRSKKLPQGARLWGFPAPDGERRENVTTANFGPMPAHGTSGPAHSKARCSPRALRVFAFQRLSLK